MEKSKVYRQAKAKRIQHHQTSSTTNAKGTSLVENTREEKDLKNKNKTIKKMVTGTYILIITLNVNGLNAPTKRHRFAECIQKQDPYICCLQENRFRPMGTYRLKVKGWKKIFHANGNRKKTGVAILTSDKMTLKSRMLQETRKDTT